jgi:hypothetical protein
MGFYTHNCAFCLATRQDWICRTCFKCEDCCTCEPHRTSLISRQASEAQGYIRRAIKEAAQRKTGGGKGTTPADG